MVGAKGIYVMLDAVYAAEQGLRNDKVVKAPTTVFQPLLQPVGPPGIGALHVWIQGAEHIQEPGVQKFFQAFPLVRKEPGRIFLIA